MTLPYSNAGFIQVFRGETQECLLERMKKIFQHMGRVPSEIWFDNLSAAVKITNRKNRKERKINKFFQAFAAHYSFKPIFCNPDSGNEKGSTENKVGYLRRNYLVPEPEFNDINEFNKKLLELCDKDHKRLHYKKKVEIAGLYQEQLKYMQKINPINFDVFRLEKRKANTLTIFDENGKELIKHDRCFEKYKTIISYKESLPLIIQKINALENTEFYQTLPKVWKDFLKDKDSEQRKRILKVLGKMLIESSIETATAVLQDTIVACRFSPDSILATYYRYVECDLKREELQDLPEKVPKIKEYDIDLRYYDKFLGRA